MHNFNKVFNRDGWGHAGWEMKKYGHKGLNINIYNEKRFLNEPTNKVIYI